MGARPGRIALVVEGGAMRGIFAAGVLDVFLEQRFHPFDLALGVSVGASNLLSYLAGQHGRARRCFLDQMSRPEFIDPWRLVRGGHWLDLDWLWEAITREDPLDCHAAAASGVEYALVATCATTGDPRYLSPGADDMLAALKASCALPFLYRGVVRVGLDALVDGGISDPVPVREAYRRGARTMVVVRSRTADFVKKDRLVNRFGAWTMRGSPAIARACRSAPEAYRDAVAFLASPPEDCRVIQIAPSASLATSRTSRDREAMERDYALGRALGRQAIAEFASEAPPRGARPAPSVSTQL
jgi:predicted patatin/cPLA2 family phospholipase